MKKILSLMLAGFMMASLVACRGAAPETNTEAPNAPTTNADDGTDAGEATAPEGGDAEEPQAAASDYKIGIITGTVSQGEEEFRAAENMKKEFGEDKIITATYPDNFGNEVETTISQVVSLATDPAVKAIVFVQAVPGASAAIEKVRETRPEILFIAGVPGEDPAVIASKADVVMVADELAMGKTIVDQAQKMGAKTLVHYSFPRHMSYAMLAERRDRLKANAEAAGMTFVDATAPDPTGDAGVPGAQQFILEDVPRKVEEYGKDTAFFSTNCSMQEPLIKSVIEQGAYLPQQCCPSPYHGYPGALGIEIPEDKQGDVSYIIEQDKEKVAEKGATGHVGTWETPINMLMVEAGVRYAVEFAEGRTADRLDDAAFRKVLAQVAGGEEKITATTYDEDGVQLPNYYMLLGDYIIF